MQNDEYYILQLKKNKAMLSNAESFMVHGETSF